MAKIFAGRYSAKIEGPFVVFVIGMRVNRVWAVNKWMPVVKAMRPMLRELAAKKASGFLHVETGVSGRSVFAVQYWRSFDQLLAYAHARDAKHLPAWAAFNRAVGNNGSVGVWHETYQVQAEAYESIYVNMPLWGMSAAGEHVESVGRMKDAKSRMGHAAQ